MKKDTLFNVRIFGSKDCKKAIFYLTSYGFPWWVYIIPILSFRRRGVQVVVYDLDRIILDNNDPHVLLEAVEAVTNDMRKRHRTFIKRKVRVLGGVGNSLGSYMLFNYCNKYQLDNIVLNGGGSISDIIFTPINTNYAAIGDKFVANGYDKKTTDRLWSKIDGPILAENIQASKILFCCSKNDGVIPFKSAKKFENGFKKSKAQMIIKYDSKPHIISVVSNAHRTKEILNFISS